MSTDGSIKYSENRKLKMCGQKASGMRESRIIWQVGSLDSALGRLPLKLPWQPLEAVKEFVFSQGLC